MDRDEHAERAHVEMVKVLADAAFAAAAAAVVGVTACLLVWLTVGGGWLLTAVVLTLPAPFVAAAASLNGRVSSLRARAARGQSIL